jgi:hypothetical protein
MVPSSKYPRHFRQGQGASTTALAQSPSDRFTASHSFILCSISNAPQHSLVGITLSSHTSQVIAVSGRGIDREMAIGNGNVSNSFFACVTFTSSPLEEVGTGLGL